MAPAGCLRKLSSMLHPRLVISLLDMTQTDSWQQTRIVYHQNCLEGLACQVLLFKSAGDFQLSLPKRRGVELEAAYLASPLHIYNVLLTSAHYFGRKAPWSRSNCSRIQQKLVAASTATSTCLRDRGHTELRCSWRLRGKPGHSRCFGAWTACAARNYLAIRASVV